MSGGFRFMSIYVCTFSLGACVCCDQDRMCDFLLDTTVPNLNKGGTYTPQPMLYASFYDLVVVVVVVVGTDLRHELTYGLQCSLHLIDMTAFH